MDLDDFDEESARPPDAVVVYLGSNDYTAQLSPLSEATFTAAYVALVDEVLSFYATPPPPVVHLCGGAAVPCDYIKRAAANRTNEVYSTTLDFGEPRSGCFGHRNRTQQQRLARGVVPIVARAAGFPVINKHS